MTTEKKPPRKTIPEQEARIAEEERGQAVALRVPFQPCEKYAACEIDTRLDQEQAATLRALLEGLENRHAKLNNGKMVAGPREALKWLLEEIQRCAKASG